MQANAYGIRVMLGMLLVKIFPLTGSTAIAYHHINKFQGNITSGQPIT